MMKFVGNIPFDCERPETFYDLGWQLLYEEGRFEDSENAFRTALELFPGNVNILLELAVACCMQDKENEGVAVLWEAIEKSQDPESLAEAHLRLGLAYDMMHNETLARIELNILKNLDPDRAGVLECLMEW